MPKHHGSQNDSQTHAEVSGLPQILTKYGQQREQIRPYARGNCCLFVKTLFFLSKNGERIKARLIATAVSIAA